MMGLRLKGLAGVFLGAAVFAGILPTNSFAALVTNQFSSNFDLSAFGGTGSDEFVLTYTYDSDISGGPLYNMSSANIRVDSLGFDHDFDNSNTSFFHIVIGNDVLSPTEDQYTLGLNPNPDVTFGTGLLTFFNFRFVDEDATMFSSGDLVVGSAFFNQVDRFSYAINTDFFEPSELSANLTTVPIPAALPLSGSAMAVLGFFGWRRKKQTLNASGLRP